MLLNFSPSAGSGDIYYRNYGFSVVRGSATGTGTSNNTSVRDEAVGGNEFVIYRGFLNFDTKIIPRGSLIKLWFLSIKRNDGICTFYNNSPTRLVIVPSMQTDPSSLNISDFGKISFSSMGSVNFSEFTGNGVTKSIIGTSINPIVPRGWTQLAILTGKDFDNSAPSTYDWIGLDNAVLTIDFVPPLDSSSMSDSEESMM